MAALERDLCATTGSCILRTMWKFAKQSWTDGKSPVGQLRRLQRSEQTGFQRGSSMLQRNWGVGEDEPVAGGVTGMELTIWNLSLCKWPFSHGAK